MRTHAVAAHINVVVQQKFQLVVHDKKVYANREVTIDLLDKLAKGAAITVVGRYALAVASGLVGNVHLAVEVLAVPNLTVGAVDSVVERERLVGLRVEAVDAESVEAMDDHDLLVSDCLVTDDELGVVRTTVLHRHEASLQLRNVTRFTNVKENSTHVAL